MAKQVFDLREGKGMSQGQSTEHLRNYKVTDPDMKKYGYYDPTRSNLNFEVGRGGVIKPVNKNYSLTKRFADNLRNRGIEDPNAKKIREGKEPNRNTVANIIIGGSRDQMHKLAFGDQKVDLSKGADNRGIQRKEDVEKWAVDMYNFIAKRFGEENIVAFIVHLDEKNPHIHCTLVPVNEKGKISYNDVLGGSKEEARRKFKALHDMAALVNAKWKLERGDDINTTGARHRTSEEYWLELRERCNSLERENGNLEQEKGSKQAAIDILNKELRRAEIAQRGLTTMINNLTAQREALQQQIDELEERNNQMDGESFSLETTIQQLAQQITELDKKIEQKKASLNEYVNRRSELIDEIVKLKQEQLDLIRKNEATKEDLERNTLARDIQVTNALGLTGFTKMGEMLQDFNSRLDKLSETLPQESKLDFDKMSASTMDFIMNLAEKGNEIIAVAAALYFENFNAADQIAQSCGGCGGGGSKGGWGRRKDEDDEAFRSRCFLMGAMMMRPAGRKLKR